MTPPKEIIWHIEPHTEAKHAILKKYLQAWFPILARWNGRIVYYDGFAGPGVYSKGEDGSPLIALNAAKSHHYQLGTELVFVFVEEHEKRAKNLQQVIEKEALPGNFRCRVINKEFETALGKTLDYVEKEGLSMAPTFAFIDPFGIKGLPFSLIERLLGNAKCEALITFMDSTIERFVSELPEQINELIGNSSASDIIASSEKRIAKARELYYSSLKRTAKFVRSFEMRDGADRTIYHLFFATNHHLGHEKMKEAMWKADESGLFRFSDATDPNQRVLFSPTPQRDLAPMLGKKFQGEKVISDKVYRYTNDETVFLEKHAREALKLLELDNGYKGYRIQVEPMKRDGSSRRKNTFPLGTTISFHEVG